MENIEMVSVENGKFHRPKDTHFERGDLKPRLMLCGRTLQPHNYFQTIHDAEKYTGNRLNKLACKHCMEQYFDRFRGALRAERISYGELAELQTLAKYIDPSDVELLEAAGVPEK